MATYQSPYQNRGTDPNFGAQENKTKANNLLKQQQCIADGGRWDEGSQTCIFTPGTVPNSALPKGNTIKQAEDQPMGAIAPSRPEPIVDAEGNPTGIRFPDGRVIRNISPREVRGLLENYGAKQAPLANAQAPGTAQAQATLAQQVQEAQAAAQQGLATPEQLASVQGASPDFGQAAGAGALGVVPGIIGGAITGAVAGGTSGTILGVPGIAAGVIGGAVTGFLLAAKNNLRSQQTDAFAADTEALRKGDRYLRSLITDTNQNPQNAPENIALFYQTLNMIDAAHAKTWADSQENLNKFLGKDGTRELSRFEVFDATMRNYYLQQFNTALVKPNPSIVMLTNEDLQEVET